MLVAGSPAGSLAANCFVLAAEVGSPCIIVDPGEAAEEPLQELLREHRLDPMAVPLTHGHFDHVFSVTPVCEGNDIPAWIHPDDRVLLSDPLRGLSGDAGQLFGRRFELREPSDVRVLEDGVDRTYRPAGW